MLGSDHDFSYAALLIHKHTSQINILFAECLKKIDSLCSRGHLNQTCSLLSVGSFILHNATGQHL